jgi:cytochrome bd-type quinol oxidase subunit 1
LADSFFALITNKHGLLEIIHVVPASLLLASFFIMGVSAWHLLRKQHLPVFERSFRIGLVVGLVTAVVVAITGDMHGVNVSKTQPAKLAAMESHWETQTRAPLVLFAIPLPYIAMEMGWIVSEVGRQPWIVYGLMRTADAASPISTTQVFTSLMGFILVYGLLGAVGFYLMAKTVKQGPEAANQSEKRS